MPALEGKVTEKKSAWVNNKSQMTWCKEKIGGDPEQNPEGPQ